MCEAHAYILRDGKEEKILEDVDQIEILENGVRLVNIFGEQKRIRARLKSYSSSDRKIILEDL